MGFHLYTNRLIHEKIRYNNCVYITNGTDCFGNDNDCYKCYRPFTKGNLVAAIESDAIVSVVYTTITLKLLKRQLITCGILLSSCILR